MFSNLKKCKHSQCLRRFLRACVQGDDKLQLKKQQTISVCLLQLKTANIFTGHGVLYVIVLRNEDFLLQMKNGKHFPRVWGAFCVVVQLGR